MSDRRAVGADRRRLALERVEPTISPLGEPDVQSGSEVTVFERDRCSVERELSVLTITTDGFLMRLVPLPDNDVVDGAVRAGAAGHRLIERRPGAIESASSRVLGLEASHGKVALSQPYRVLILATLILKYEPRSDRVRTVPPWNSDWPGSPRWPNY